MWDVLVVGAGPAGSAAAETAARRGARVLVLDRSVFPRYKTCGGGLTGVSLRSVPPGCALPDAVAVRRISVSHDGRRTVRRNTAQPFLAVTYRDVLDAALVEAARRSGAQVRTGVTVRRFTEHPDRVEVDTGAGLVTAAVVVGADGSAGRVAAQVGVQCAQVDLGLEVEIPLDAARRDPWRDRLHLDWGPLPGSYGWVFPKVDGVGVGVIGDRQDGAQLRTYLADFLGRLGLDALPRRVESGHLTRCRLPASPLRRGRFVVAGDAAGLLDPWTREGISFALRSGRMAGESAARAAGTAGPPALEDYEREVAATLLPEMAAGARMLAVFRERPGLLHAALASPVGWRFFLRYCRGEVSLASAARYPGARLALRMAGAGGGITLRR